LTIKSTAELQPQGVNPLDGIEISVDGKPLTSAFVSVLELSNSGSKPVIASDFEGPIRILTLAPSGIVKARFTSATPASLEPDLTFSEEALLLQPLLLNPGDILRFTVIAAKGKPEYSVRGRIAGISEITVSATRTRRETRLYWLGAGIATLLLVIYMINMMEFVRAVILNRRYMARSLATGVTSGFGAAFIIVMQSHGDPLPPPFLPIPMIIAALLTIPLVFMRQLKRIET